MCQRKRKLLMGGGVLLLAGLAYAGFCKATGWALPCLFYKLTGLYCPGCGVTRMCLALLRLDFPAAFAANKGVFAALPVLAVLLAWSAYRWVKELSQSRMEQTAAWVLLGYFLLYGLLRNLPAFSRLAPMG